MSIAENPLPLFGACHSAEPRQPLTKSDRCDACGAEAYVALVKLIPAPTRTVVEPDAAIAELEQDFTEPAMRESELLFCAHHFERFRARLAEQGAVVTRDERRRLAQAEGALPVHPG